MAAALRAGWPCLLAVSLLAACAQKPKPPKRERHARSEGSALNTPVAPSPAPSDSEDPAQEVAPAPELVTLDGPGVLELVRTNAGHGTIVNLWASWCGPCRRELPMFRSLTDNLRARGIGVLLVSVDEQESEPELVRMLKAEGFAPPFYVAQRPLDSVKQAIHPGWPGMIPATFLFDASARRRYFWAGPVYEQDLLPITEGLIAGRDVDGEARFDLAPGAQTGP